MKFEQLHLKPFGHFEDKEIHFSTEPGVLNLIYGPNEAGKSTTLEAIHEFLYGFKVQTPFDFVFDKTQLKIGAKIQSLQGESLNFTRLKKNKNNLLDANEEPVPEAAITGLLSGIDSHLFRQFFGLHHDQLSQGGKEIMDSQGELGRLLFSSGSGLTGLQSALKTIEEKANQLFVRNGKKQVIPQALSQLKNLRKEVAEASTPPKEWVELETQLKETQEALEKINQQQRQHLDESEKLKRYKQALRHFGAWNNLQEELLKHKKSPRLRSGFKEERIELQKKLLETNIKIEDFETRITELKIKEKNYSIPRKVEIAKDEIQRLAPQIQIYHQNQAQLKVEQQALAQIEELTTKKLKSIDKSRTWSQIESLFIDLHTRQSISRLQKDYIKGIEAREHHEAALKETQQNLKALKGTLKTQSDYSFLPTLQSVLKKALQAGDLETKKAECQIQIESLENSINKALKTLLLPFTSLDELHQFQLPSADEIEIFNAEEDELHQRLKQNEGKTRELHHSNEELEKLTNEISQGKDLPHLKDLDDARALRDRGWLLIRKELQEIKNSEEDKKEYLIRHEDALNLEEAFKSDLDQTDALSDLLIEESERITHLERNQKEIQKNLAKIEELSQQSENIRGELENLKNRWKNLWSNKEKGPESPAEATRFLNEVEAILSSESQLNDFEVQLKTLITQERQLKGELKECLNDTKVSPAPQNQSWNTYLAQFESIENLADKELRLQEDLNKNIDELSRREQIQSESLQETIKRIENLQEEWERLLEPMNLPSTPTPDEFDAYLNNLDELQAQFKDWTDRKNLVEKLETTIHTYEQEARDLAQHLGEEFNTPSDYLGKLKSLLDQADRWEEHQNERKICEEQLREKKLAQKEQLALLDQLCKEAGCKNVTQLEEQELLSDQLQDLEKQREATKGNLLDHAGGTTLEVFLEELQELELDSLNERISTSEENLENVTQEKEALLERKGKLQKEKDLLEQNVSQSKAQSLNAQWHSGLTHLKNNAEEFINYKLSSWLLRQGMERYRKNHQGPLLSRSQAIFKELTSGNYQTLEVDHHEKTNEPFLTAVRVDSQGRAAAVTVDGLSDGTRDQLYLALRLAALELFLERHGAFPFVVDDILVHFDDQRSQATLNVLRELAQKTQVIFFTHHIHLIQLAKEALGDQNLNIQVLDRPVERQA